MKLGAKFIGIYFYDFCEGSIAENIYIIQHGRLQLISENNDGEKIVLAEFSKNDFVGMVFLYFVKDESFEQKRRLGSLTAVRYVLNYPGQLKS